MNLFNTIQIDIPTPCNEDWEKMTPCGQGRHCAHCDKTVIDFTKWSDTALYEFFTKDHGKVCGRFHTSQLGRDIRIPPQPYSRLYRMVVAMGLTLIFAQGAEVYGQSKPPVVMTDSATNLKEVTKPVVDTGNYIIGTILDDKKQPIIGAIIQVSIDGVVAGGASTDFDGNYKVGPLKDVDYEMTVQYIGYMKTTIKHVRVGNPVDVTMNIANNVILGGGVIVWKNPLLARPGTMTFGGGDIKNMPIR